MRHILRSLKVLFAVDSVGCCASRLACLVLLLVACSARAHGGEAGASAGGVSDAAAVSKAAAHAGVSPAQIDTARAKVAAQGGPSSEQMQQVCAEVAAKHLTAADIESMAGSMGLSGDQVAQLKNCGQTGTTAEAASAATPATPASATPPSAPASPPETPGLSSVEKSFHDLASPYAQVASPTPAALTQFGYSLFSEPVSTFAPVSNVPVGSDYILGPGDEMNVLLWGRVNQTLHLKVERDGTVQMPQLGPFQVAGLTFEQAKKLIEGRAGQITGVQVNVTMGQIRTIQVFVIGEVRTPGLYTVSALSHVSNALVAAGGISKIGSLRNIPLRRGNQTVEVVDLYRMLLEGDTSADVRLEPRDVIFVPAIGSVVGVSGDVKRPAIYELRGGENLRTALKMAGGVSAFGYSRRLQVERIDNHERRVALDTGLGQLDARKFSIHDGDLIKVFTVLPQQQNVVALKGNVNRPGIYQWHPGMKVADLVREGEGVADHTFFGYALVRRIEGSDRRVRFLPVDLGAALENNGPPGETTLKPRDTLTIYNERDLGELPQVSVTGAVRKPGAYPLTEGMKLSDLIYEAGGLRDNAYPRAALAHTQIANGAVRYSAEEVDLKQVLGGVLHLDPLLRRDDHLFIQSVAAGELPQVSVVGAVRKPGLYPLTEGMKLSDLVYQAGGLMDNAYPTRAELVRTKIVNGVARYTYEDVNLKGTLSRLPGFDPPLQRDDRLFVQTASNWHKPWEATISGEVLRPGLYVIREGERLASLLRRCGGLRSNAYLPATIFVRQSVKQLQQERLDESRLRLQKQAARLSLMPQQPGQKPGDLTGAMAMLQEVLASTEAQQAVGRVVLHLTSLAALDRSVDNLALENADSIVVPQRPASVNVLGQVYNPTAIVYEPNLTVRDYLQRAGGPTPDADEDRIFVTQANGSILTEDGIRNSNKNALFPLLPVISGGLMQSRLGPGDTVYVPEKLIFVSGLQYATDITQIIANSAMSLGVLGILGASL